MDSFGFGCLNVDLVVPGCFRLCLIFQGCVGLGWAVLGL